VAAAVSVFDCTVTGFFTRAMGQFLEWVEWKMDIKQRIKQD
jgi:hypothetical protein